MRVYDEWANICGTDGMLGPAGATAEQLISTLLAPVAQLTRSSLTDHTVYECVQCGDQRLGEHRCQECNLMMRKIGLGAVCPSCDELLLLQELLEPIGLRVHQPILTRQPMRVSS